MLLLGPGCRGPEGETNSPGAISKSALRDCAVAVHLSLGVWKPGGLARCPRTLSACPPTLSARVGGCWVEQGSGASRVVSVRRTSRIA